MIQWEIKSFEQLSSKELYKIIQLRINIFMLEQNCLYPECDDKDYHANHIFAVLNNEVIAYARLLPPGISYPEASIGRVIVSASQRGNNLGYLLMRKSIDKLNLDFPDSALRISAQAHLQPFYENMGFTKQSEMYLEDNIPHIEMLFTNKKEE